MPCPRPSLRRSGARLGKKKKRAELMQQAETILLRELPVLPIYFYVSKNLVSAKIKGWEDNIFDTVYVKNLSFAK